jgi:spore germination protein GerM
MSARKKRSGPGCLTGFLVLMVVLMVSLVGIVGWIYLKDTGWLETRTTMLGGKPGGLMTRVTSLLKRPSTAAPRVQTEPESVETGAEIEPVSAVKETARTVESAVKTVRSNAPTVRTAVKTATTAVKKTTTAAKTTVRKTMTTAVKTTTTAAKTGAAVKKTTATAVKKTAAPTEVSAARTVTLYLIRYDDATGKMSFEKVSRSQPASTSPLLQTLQLLFAGPSDAEESRQVSSAIPGGVKVLSATVKDGTALVNLGSGFASGTGRELMLARVYQVVYTATQYPTIKRVRILVNGASVTSLAGEGVDLSKPLGRTLAEPVRF